MGILNFVKRSIVFLLLLVTVIIVPNDTVANDTSGYFTVVIDPGHGGRDGGAPGKFSNEKDIVLAISLLTGKYIEENLDSVRIIFTRTTDEYIELYKRADIANKADADLFVSVHVNANTSSRPYGTSSYVLGLHRSDENFEVAKRENSVILLEEDYSENYQGFDPNSEDSYIMFRFMQNFFDKQSIYMAKLMQDQFRERVRRHDRGVFRQGILVLAQASMPAILVETGFISNPNEEKYLNTKEGQEFIASAIYRAIKNYIKTINHVEKEEIVLEGPVAVDPLQENRQVAEVMDEKPEQVTDPVLGPIAGSEANNPFFKVQVLTSKSPIDIRDEIFRDFNDVEEFYSNGKYRYVVGYGQSYNEIMAYSKLVKNRFPDAFIVGIEDGKIVSARSILKKNE